MQMPATLPERRPRGDLPGRTIPPFRPERGSGFPFEIDQRFPKPGAFGLRRPQEKRFFFVGPRKNFGWCWVFAGALAALGPPQLGKLFGGRLPSGVRQKGPHECFGPGPRYSFHFSFIHRTFCCLPFLEVSNCPFGDVPPPRSANNFPFGLIDIVFKKLAAPGNRSFSRECRPTPLAVTGRKHTPAAPHWKWNGWPAPNSLAPRAPLWASIFPLRKMCRGFGPRPEPRDSKAIFPESDSIKHPLSLSHWV